MVCFHLIFHKQPTNLMTYSLIFLEKPFCRIRVNSCVVCALFPRKNKVFTQNHDNPVVLTFYFDLVLPFYFLKLDRCFSTYLRVLKSIIYVLITTTAMYEIIVKKKILPAEFWWAFRMYAGLHFQSDKCNNKWLINIMCFLNYFCGSYN